METADQSRERAIQAKKNQDARDLLDSVFLDIKDSANQGCHSTTYPIRETSSSTEHVPVVLDYLTESGYEVNAVKEPGKTVLNISWPAEN